MNLLNVLLHTVNWLAPLVFMAGAMTLWAGLRQRRARVQVAPWGKPGKLKRLFVWQLFAATGAAVLAWYIGGVEGTMAYWLMVCGACALIQCVYHWPGKNTRPG